MQGVERERVKVTERERERVDKRTWGTLAH